MKVRKIGKAKMNQKIKWLKFVSCLRKCQAVIIESYVQPFVHNCSVNEKDIIIHW